MSDHDSVAALLRTTIPDHQFRFVEALLADPDLDLHRTCKAIGISFELGRRWLQNDRVRDCLGQLVRQRAARHADIRDGVIVALWAIATADPRKAWTKNGTQLQPHELPDELAAALISAKPVMSKDGPTGLWTYTFSDKSKILLDLLRHFGDIAAGRKDVSEAMAGGVGTNNVKIIFRGVDENARE